jgi:hypothetical protein
MTVDNRYDGRGSEPPYESRECVEMRERTTAMVIELEQLEKQIDTLTARIAEAEQAAVELWNEATDEYWFADNHAAFRAKYPWIDEAAKGGPYVQA